MTSETPACIHAEGRRDARTNGRGGIILTIVLILLVLAQAAVSAVFALQCQLIDSDIASEFVFAKLMADQGHWLYAEDWIAATGWSVINCPTIIRILCIFMTSYRGMLAAYAAVSTILIALSCYALLRTVDVSRNFSLLGSLLITVPGTALHAVSIEAPYYTFYVIATPLILCLYLRGRRSGASRGNRLLFMGLAVLVCFIMGLNDYRMLAYCGVPLLCCELLRSLKMLWNTRLDTPLVRRAIANLLPSIVLCLAIGIGYVVGYTFVEPLYGSGSAYNGAQFYSDYDQVDIIAERFTLLAFNTVNIFGFAAASDVWIQSPLGILGFCVFLITFVGYGSLLKLRAKSRADLSSEQTLVGVFVLFAAFFSAFLIVYMIEDNTAIWRYIPLGLICLFPWVVICITKVKESNQILKILCIAAVTVFIAFGNLVYLHHITRSEAPNPDEAGYVRFLMESDYSFGESTYWHATVTTALTDGKIEMKGIEKADNPTFVAWLTRASYADKTAEFLLLTQKQLAEVNVRGGTPPGTPVYSDEYYVIYDLASSSPS